MSNNKNKKSYNIKVTTSIDWITKIFIANLLWVLFNVFGLVVFTIMPTTIAIYLIVINLMKKREFPTAVTFWRIFKKEYIKSQIVFLILFAIGLFISFSLYFYYIGLSNGTLFLVLFFIMLFMAFLYVITCAHVIPVYIHFPHLKPIQIIKQSFVFSVALLFHSISIIVLSIIILLLFFYVWYFRMFAPILLVTAIVFFTYKIIQNKYLSLIKNEEVLDIKKYDPRFVDKQDA